MTATPELLDTTPERLLKADNDNIMGADGVRRMVDWPLARLAARGLLDKHPDTNRVLYEAGTRYAEDHHISGMDTLSGFDPTRVFVGGESSAGMPRSELQAIRRDSYRRATAALGGRYQQVLYRFIVRQDDDLITIGRDVSAYQKRETARAVAFDRLIGGLHVLASFYRMV